ncbi:hypothetical protein CIB48_g10708 [Xylaria polymorpha]|nr:hypothetical protein CIB48_g10708 [Xylaria polymorpha]
MRNIVYKTTASLRLIQTENQKIQNAILHQDRFRRRRRRRLRVRGARDLSRVPAPGPRHERRPDVLRAGPRGLRRSSNSESDSIVALSKALFDQYTPNGNPNLNSLCGRQIQINLGGNSAVVTVEDRCEGCQYNDLDVPIAVFSRLADPNAGRVQMTWNWL